MTAVVWPRLHSPGRRRLCGIFIATGKRVHRGPVRHRHIHGSRKREHVHDDQTAACSRRVSTPAIPHSVRTMASSSQCCQALSLGSRSTFEPSTASATNASLLSLVIEFIPASSRSWHRRVGSEGAVTDPKTEHPVVSPAHTLAQWWCRVIACQQGSGSGTVPICLRPSYRMIRRAGCQTGGSWSLSCMRTWRVTPVDRPR